MSRRSKQPAAASGRRTRRAEPAEFVGFTESQQGVVVSNPIFYCGPALPQPSKPAPGDRLRCVFRAGAVGTLVHDPAAAAARSSGVGDGKPLPLPPCRAHNRRAASRVVPAVLVGCPHGRVLRRRAQPPPHHQDPFLAAYVACVKASGDENGGGARVKRQHSTKKKEKEERTGGRGRRGEKGEVVVRGRRAVWNGWAAGAKQYAAGAAAMSCKMSCAVVVDAHAAAAPKAKLEEEEEREASEAPTLDLSWAPVVLSARAMERRRQQRF